MNLKPISGIYKIENIQDNKVYIGSSKDINLRIKRHKSILKGNRHENRHLQNSFNIYGIDNFTFNILELCKEDDLLNREKYYIDLFIDDLGRQFLYNRDLIPKKGNPGKRDVEFKKKISESSSKTYDGFISPDGTIYSNVRNLSKFSKEHNLSQDCMCDLNQQIIKSHKGWRRIKEFDIEKPKMMVIGKLDSKTFVYPGIVSPEGTIYNPVCNLRKFCRDHDLIYSGVRHLYRNEVFQYKGWKLLNSNIGEI